jgi:hypothetical protein
MGGCGKGATETQLATSLSLCSKVCLINGAVFVAATSLQVVSPATVSNRVTCGELAFLALGLALILATNAALGHGRLALVDRLVQRLSKFDTDAQPEKTEWPPQPGAVWWLRPAIR